ncbi:hypothetical protein A2454_03240 [Candidatus Peribacteria bacterium RIFOXYC2_FULL_55_14]|nr:MAG: hypothetical protein UY85_C0043G0003 [Candidatus Peribacteria bacterium GW2011_GWB1_54_5]KKW38872.1 MAG: hypothetical protein UY87_C0060G0007 [Candidatus Peribacteria bacterium GW2011_GWC2_54_8]KKW44164.1 MAG: hypothetical protein UY90_C0018G0014 [Candidatus Peregrinibacteria bacterium GW2011_GWA2_54_9]OGJ71182.1 MAG: hypothetical protein A2198_01615 [Candidatus Peribacteria bacterium RIFOXYA1_FULL_56_14]OGJ73817.1 MAG: hypothetical protein A2384_04560 [Candidatus Peribacteria bacterium
MVKVALIRYSADVKRCLKDCLLGIFYKKDDLICFLRDDCGCTNADLRGIDSSLIKSQIVDILYGNIDERGNSGKMQLHTIIQNVLQWSDFGSYWFKKEALNAEEAKKDIERLKKMIGEKTKEDERVQELHRRKAEIEAKRLKQQTLTDLCESFSLLAKMNNEAQERGFAFEKFLQELFGFFDIRMEKPYKLIGEQIDGSFKLQGDNSYICEARWKDEPSTTNALYHFAHKVSTKNLYPRGAFISVNGFSKEAVHMICQNNAPNIFLIDGADLVCVLEELISLPDLLYKKIELSQTRGEIYVSSRTILSTSS